MSSNDYHFITHWRVQSTAEEITDILSDAQDLSRWWPSVYLEVKDTQPGDERGIGKTFSLYTKGWLPYTLRWTARVIDNNAPYGFTIEASGDFVGRGIWTLAQDGAWVNITYDWKISANKPLLKQFSFLLKPVFSMNHHWAMQKGEESLLLELRRRHAKSADELAQIPPPPAPTFKFLLPARP
jgi:hypothetical protein